MGKVGGERNFGYGKQMAWAGKNALADRYGDGHYGTQAAHGDRWLSPALTLIKLRAAGETVSGKSSAVKFERKKTATE